MSYRSNNENDVAKIIGIIWYITLMKLKVPAKITSRDTYVTKPVIGGLLIHAWCIDPVHAQQMDIIIQTPGYFGHRIMRLVCTFNT